MHLLGFGWVLAPPRNSKIKPGRARARTIGWSNWGHQTTNLGVRSSKSLRARHKHLTLQIYFTTNKLAMQNYKICMAPAWLYAVCVSTIAHAK